MRRTTRVKKTRPKRNTANPSFPSTGFFPSWKEIRVLVAFAWIDLDDPTDRAVVEGLARELGSLGHRVLAVGPRRRFSQQIREEREGFSVRYVGSPFLEFWPLLADAFAAVELLGLHFLREKPDLWHCHVFARRHRALTWAAALGRWPLLASLHLVLPDYLASAGGRSGLGALLRRAFQVTAASKASLEDAVLLFPEIEKKASVIPNGISFSKPEAVAGAPGAGSYILCASRLAPYKGLDILLMAFAQLKDKGHKLSLVLCGRDQMKGGLEKFSGALGLGKEVYFMGDLPHGQIRHLMEHCLFFALPSRRENVGLALLEAMAAGKPVVASAAGGVPEIVTDGEDGMLVPPGNVEALVKAMAALASDGGLRERLGRRAKERSRVYDWRRSALAYVQLYGKR